MSSDERRNSTRRARRPKLPPGPLRDLKYLLYELYLAAGPPTMDQIAAEIAEADDLSGAPSRDTIHRIITQGELPPSQADVVATATVLARMSAWDQGDAVARVRTLWMRAMVDVPIGTPIEELKDPFAFEVHRSIEVGGDHGPLPLLPCYVPRAHDNKLTDAVNQADGGKSTIVTLVGGSSTGKTRACWEAIHQMPRGWRLWHPVFPDRAEAFLVDLQRVRPRTVVWLNDAQLYLQTANPALGEQVAAGLWELLRDEACGPVLVLATLWREYWETLTTPSPPGEQNPHAQAGRLLTGSLIEVPESFTKQQLRAELAAAAAKDPRLAQAAEHARDGQITQYLAGVPVLVERYTAAPPAARALIDAAIDARRLGHGPALPYAMLEVAASGYLSDLQWEQTDEDWLEQAFAYAARPCNGVRGPLSPIKPRPISPRKRTQEPDVGSGTPPQQADNQHYWLADYLDQAGRAQRADVPVPIAMWDALTLYGNSDDLPLLAGRAEDRGLLRCAAQMRKNAIMAGNCLEAVTFLQRLGHVDIQIGRQAAAWVAAAVRLDNPRSAAGLLSELRDWGVDEAFIMFANRAARQVSVDDADKVFILLGELGHVGYEDGTHGQVSLVGSPEETREAVTVLADRAAHQVPLDDVRGIARLLMKLRWTNAQQAITTLVARDPAGHVRLNKSTDVAFLLDELREAGADEAVAILADRAAHHAPLDDAWGIAQLLMTLQKLDDQEPLATLLARRPADQVSLDNSLGVVHLLEALQEVGAVQAVADLVNRAAYQLSDSMPFAVGQLLQTLEKFDAREARAVLVDRVVHEASHKYPKAIANWLGELQKANAKEAVIALADDAALQAPLDDPDGVASLLWGLRKVGAQRQATVLADRVAHDARQVRLHDRRLFALLHALRTVGAEEAVTALLARDPAGHAFVNDPDSVAYLLKELREVGAQRQVTKLADRAAHQVSLHGWHHLNRLLRELRTAEAWQAVTTLTDRAVHGQVFQKYLDPAGDPARRFRYGQRPDGSPEAPWRWEDLA